ncbi:MAG TPA: LptF/LptG family permease [Puia sp.]|uniref:LptF/LptG family permease n=1 Tax=Puia sp. TaxID=2045100 RepID=UPI002C517D1D|nr:LptF/LptG family permease [Puia sp.]HVU98662.1 LptF/LptG family permease [Puia sp.]
MLSRLFKKLDILIIKAFIGPFLATFFVTLFVLVLQFMWLYIDDFVGKGLDTFTVLRMLMYVAATTVPLALPLAVLLSSIMTLGNLGETYELVAIKSAGISLLRFLRPLFVVSFVITCIAFYFNNNILPYANLKMNTLKYDIIVSKPAFAIKEGVFYDKIEGFVIKIGKKERDDSTIRNVVIYEQNNNGQQDNMIVADSGTMVVSPDKQSLIFTLRSGSRYQEKMERGSTTGSELIRMSFKTYKKVLDLSSFRMNKTDDSTFKDNYQMKSVIQLAKIIDSIKGVENRYARQASQGVNMGMKFPAYLDTTGWDAIDKKPVYSHYLLPIDRVRDTLRREWAVALRRQDSTDRAQDSIRKKQDSQRLAQEALQKERDRSNPSGGASSNATGSTPANTASAPAPLNTNTPPGQAPGQASRVPRTAPDPRFSDLLPDSVRLTVMDKAINAISSAKVALVQPVTLYAAEQKTLLHHEEAWHEKFTMAVACMVMFLIGAPLGSIIRKGGIGMPLVFAVIFFVIFFLLNNFGRKFVSQAVMTPLAGMWMPTYVLTPIGLFLVYKALNDSQLFNKEFYFRLTKKIRPLFTLIGKWTKRKKISPSNVG